MKPSTCNILLVLSYSLSADNGDKEADDEDEGEDEEDGPEGNLLGEGGKEDENYDEEPQEDDLLGKSFQFYVVHTCRTEWSKILHVCMQ